MKKKSKIIIIIVILIVLLVGIFLFLKFKTNLFLDTSDLVCSQSYNSMDDKNIIVFKFNKQAIVTEYVEKQLISFETEELAKKTYDKAKDYKENISEEIIVNYYKNNIELNGNNVVSSFYFKIKKNDEMYKKTKKEIKKIYEEEYKYECE